MITAGVLHRPQWAHLVTEASGTSWPHASVLGHLVALLENPDPPSSCQSVIHGQQGESSLSNYSRNLVFFWGGDAV